MIPYFLVSAVSGGPRTGAALVLLVLTAVFSFWFYFLPRRAAYDLGFLVIAAWPIVIKLFGRIYLSPDRHLHLDVLGQLMWIRVGLVALLVLREWDAGPVSFWPKRREWKIGARLFAIVILPLAALALGIGDVHPGLVAGPWWRTPLVGVGTFFGVLWVVAVGEEVFFRGFLQRWIQGATASPVWAVVISAILFGSAHLWFRAFPNWRQVLVATVLGVACGSAYLQAGSVRASMVTHALAVATWRMVLNG